MPYTYTLSPQLEKQLGRLKKKDPVLFLRVQKKVLDIARNPDPYKTLKYAKGKVKRVHIDPFVLLFSITENEIEFLTLEHHDRAYRY